jgi:hypothetical protein
VTASQVGGNPERGFETHGRHSGVHAAITKSIKHK